MTHASSPRPRFRRGDWFLIPTITVVVAAVLIGGRFVAGRLGSLDSLSLDLRTCGRLALTSLGVVMVLALLQSRTLGSRAYVVASTLLVAISGAVIAVIDSPDRGAAVWIKAGLAACATVIAAIWLNVKRG